MNILTISLNAWNDTQATGNTFSNFFQDASDDINFANIYCREEPIDNNICSKYFLITEKAILKSFFRQSSCGHEVLFSKDGNNHNSQSIKQGNLSSVKNWIYHNLRPSLLLFVREFIWIIGRWKSNQLDAFLKDFAPDVIYMHGHNNRYMHNLLWYCQNKTGAKVVVFWGDDMYGIKSRRPGQLLYHIWLRKKLLYSIMRADLLLGGSLKLCEEYSNLFKKDFHPLFKTCVSIPSPRIIEKHSPIDLVYAGNLLYGRKELLKEVVAVIAECNNCYFTQFRLFIYSNSRISEKESELLNDGISSFFMGPRPYSEICNILNNCDLSLYLESFDRANIRQTRLSFSTKIIDYLQSTSALIVFGPEEIASVDYLKNANIGFIAHNFQQLREAFEMIDNNQSVINEFAQKKYIFALDNHTHPQLINMMKKLLNSNN